MPIPRRDFMKVFGISLGSLLLARCARAPSPEPTYVMSCYQPTAKPWPTDTPTPEIPDPRRRLHLCWLQFGELAEKSRAGADGADAGGEELKSRMTADHRAALDELAAAGEIGGSTADLIQEAYTAAVFHIWRSNAPLTCYIAAPPPYTPASADDLVLQAQALDAWADAGTIEPGTLAKARAAIERDLAFYALSDAEVQALYERLREEYGTPPDFKDVDLALTPEVAAAAEFLLNVLMIK